VFVCVCVRVYVCVCVCIIVTECDQLQQSLSARPKIEYLEEAGLKELHIMTIYCCIYF